jgi:hypothetical protein
MTTPTSNALLPPPDFAHLWPRFCAIHNQIHRLMEHDNNRTLDSILVMFRVGEAGITTETLVRLAYDIVQHELRDAKCLNISLHQRRYVQL